MGLIGRDADFGLLVDVLEAARSGQSGAVLVRGEAGMGKSALLAAVVEHARTAGTRVREVRGVPGEADFGFAGLQRLLDILFMDGYRGLPRPQREALGAAIGLLDPSAPDRFLVGLAALTLLAETEPGRPKLLVIDDAHWLDRESLDTLAFVARRIRAESLAIVFGARSEGAGARVFDGFRPLARRAVGRGDVRAAVGDGRLGRRPRGRPSRRGRHPRESAGRRRARPRPLPGPARQPRSPADSLPIGRRLEGLYAGRVRALPGSTQQLLLIAAADPGAHLATVWAAGAIAGLDADALDAAQLAELVDVDATVTFRHPLVRSAVYRRAAPADRRRAHALPAEVTRIPEG